MRLRACSYPGIMGSTGLTDLEGLWSLHVGNEATAFQATYSIFNSSIDVKSAAREASV
jgi:hypothetical protein